MENALALPAHPLEVFVVEDSAPVRERLEELVGSIAGAHCAGSAESAAGAIAGIRRLRPDAVILDIRLSEGTGFDVMRALRGEHPAPEFYVLSSFALEPYRRLALKLGAAAFLDKATEMAAIRGLLEQHAARHAPRTH
ncbi:MAG TPA: response regulator [Burkholderiales bacterium]|nr:response regulator [Burkholderiales bacterium]